MPALALAEALTAKGAAVSFIGTPRGLETKLVGAAGYELDLADLRGLERRLSPRLLLFFWSLVKGAFDCAAILRRRRPQAVVGVGGYVSGMPVLLAWLRRTPTLTVELDSHMGLANRVLIPFTRRVALCFPETGRNGDRYFEAGRPLSRKLLEAEPEAGRRQFGLGGEGPVVLVMGGSLGARSINDACVEAFGSGALSFQLLHISGRRDYEAVRARLQEGGADWQNYHLVDYTNDLPLALAAADLVVGRSGASVLELAALGKPSMLIPYPYATADHQRKNAEWMAAAGAAEMIPDAELSAAVLKERVAGLLEDRTRLKVMAKAAAGLGQRDGAGQIAAEIYRIAR